MSILSLLPTHIDYSKVRTDIEKDARPSILFYFMNFLSAIIAGYGLLGNSPAVVIGAMLIAMMVGPITGIALALIEYRIVLLRQSLFALVTGGLLIYAVGLVLGWLHPEQTMTHEILSRTSPNTMDLVVALAGGIAGACAIVSKNLSVAVVGVAVATALVPPLTASGILLANGHYAMALGAFLLTFTNILAIQFTNSLVLWVAGFRRNHNVKSLRIPSRGLSQIPLFIRQNLLTLILLVTVSGYLSVNFKQTLQKQQYETAIKSIITETLKNQPNYLVSTTFDANQKDQSSYLVRVLLQGLTPPDYTQVQAMESQIAQLTHSQYPSRAPVKLQVRFIPEQVIESRPITKEAVKLDSTAINTINKTP